MDFVGGFMEEVIKIIKELQDNSGKRLQEILEEHKDNQILKDVLYFVYNPFIVTGLSSKKINKDLSNMTIIKVPKIRIVISVNMNLKLFFSRVLNIFYRKMV